MIVREVTRMKSRGSQMGGFCLVVELARVGSVTNRVARSTLDCGQIEAIIMFFFVFFWLK